jgi:hypothetical protein
MLKDVKDGRSITPKRVVLRLSSSKVGVYNVYKHIRGGQCVRPCADKSVSSLNVQETKCYGLEAYRVSDDTVKYGWFSQAI